MILTVPDLMIYLWLIPILVLYCQFLPFLPYWISLDGMQGDVGILWLELSLLQDLEMGHLSTLLLVAASFLSIIHFCD